MTTLLLRLAAEGVLRCPACRAPIDISAGSARCSGCARPYSFENGAVDLYGNYHDRGEQPGVDAAFCSAVADALRFPADAAVRERVARAVSASALAADNPAYTAEIAELSDRLGIAAPAAMPDAAPGVEYNTGIRVRVEAAYLEARLPAACEVMRTIRLRNLGPTWLSSDARPPAFLSYHWLREDGTIAVEDGLRSRLPIDLAPGAPLSVLAIVETPRAPGRYVLRLRLVLESVQWFDIEGGDFPVIVDADPIATFGIGQSGINFSYAEDHGVGGAMVARHLALLPGTSTRRLLEIGGGIHPQASWLVQSGCEVVSVDISFCMAQLGALYFEHVEPRGGLAFVASDAHAPPFAESTFDCATMFATLHHFAEPVRMLAALARVTKPEGFIAVMCEPCAPDPLAEAYLRDLRKGINEQVWTLQEYGVIFERAGLRAVAGQVDGASLKVILERR